MRRIFLFPLLPLAVAACSESPVTGPDQTTTAGAASLGLGGGPGAAGAVFVMSNAVGGNAVLIFPRAGDGSLGAPTSVPTGGLGSGGGLGNQGALVQSANDHFLYAVNPGSDEISAFRLTAGGLAHLGNVSSGGDLPISVAVRGNLLYVLNDGAEPNVTGYRVGQDGLLTMIAGSARALSVPVPNAAQVGISLDGRRVVVTEKATNIIVGWDLTDAGLLINRTLTPSAGPTPFGFVFGPGGSLLVSEAFMGAPDAGVLSSYRPGAAGWAGVSPLVATTETAACWVVVTPNGQFAYVTNTGSGTVSGFAVGPDGALSLLDADGVTGITSAGPIDADISRNGRFLYTLNSRANAISAFRIGSDGSLTHLGDTAGLPAGANGLVAR